MVDGELPASFTRPGGLGVELDGFPILTYLQNSVILKFGTIIMTQLEYDNIFDAITDDPIEAADLTLRSDLVNTLVAIFKERGWKNSHIGAALNIPQSRVSELVRGKIAVLSVQKLFGYLAVLGYRFRPSLDGSHHVICRVEERQREAA